MACYHRGELHSASIQCSLPLAQARARLIAGKAPPEGSEAEDGKRHRKKKKTSEEREGEAGGKNARGQRKKKKDKMRAAKEQEAEAAAAEAPEAAEPEEAPKADSKQATSVEADGGLSGRSSDSFSLGAMPPNYKQPAANKLFPELMEAAFQLEVSGCAVVYQK